MTLVAHRTPHSRTACERLADAGARVFEADVQVDRRGGVVISHYQPFGPGGLLQRDNWRVRWYAAAARDAQLSELASLVPDDCRILLDLKERTPQRRAGLRDALAATLTDRDRYIACSANPDDLADLRVAGFRTWRTAGTAADLDALFDEDGGTHAAATVRHSLLTEEVVRQLHESVPTVVAWTVNDPRRAQWLRDIGVDGVTTDRVAVLRAWQH